jgi:uncharacterized protein (TIGR02246 family)
MNTKYTLPTIVLTWAWIASAASASAQVPSESRPPGAVQSTQPGASAPAPTPLTDRPADEKAVRSVADVFVRAYNAGDAKTIAALYTDDAEFIDEHGGRIQGRSVIYDLYASIFQERPGATIGVSIDSLRFLGPDVAKEEGQTRVRAAGQTAETVRRYTVLFVKHAGQWLYSSVREEHAADLLHHERLKELEWLVGEWLDQSPDATVHVTCRWSDDKNFLLREFTIHVQGQPVMTVSQRIGWDPLAKQVKSWVFDSEGGYGDALWTRDKERWIIKSTGVLPDGRIATATNTLTRVGPNQVSWSSTERTLGTEMIPEPAQYVMVRKPPHAQAK